MYVYKTFSWITTVPDSIPSDYLPSLLKRVGVEGPLCKPRPPPTLKLQ